MIRAALLTVCLIADPLHAQNGPAAAAEKAAEALAQTAAALDAAKGARDRVRALTETIQAYERGLEALRDGLRRARLAETRMEAKFQEAESRHAALLGALLTLRSAPVSVGLLHPSGPVPSAQAHMILSDIAPALEAEASALRADLDELADLRAVQAHAEETLLDGLAHAQEARAFLSNAISERDSAAKASPTDIATMQALVSSADTLQGFATSLAPLVTESFATETAFADLRGTLPLPALGRVVLGFREADATGRARPGLTLAVPARAIVTAPHAGTLRYAGQLLDLGMVVILEPEAGTLLIFAGLAETYGVQGDVIAEGAPLGLMGGSAPGADRNLIESAVATGQDRVETLYIEVRQDQSPRDPADWFDLAEKQE